MEMNKYRDWDVLEVLPLGWKIDKSCGSPLSGYDFCTDGKSVLNGGKRALVKTIRKGTPRIEFIEPIKETKIVEKKRNTRGLCLPCKYCKHTCKKKVSSTFIERNNV